MSGVENGEYMVIGMSNDKCQNQMTNEIQKSNVKVYDLEERTAKFGEDVIFLAKKLIPNEINKILITQLIRSATSVGANYMEADGADSKKDFKYKMAICRKEAKESKYWLRMIGRTNDSNVQACRILWNEAQELTRIFSRIILNTSNGHLRI